MVVQMVSEQSNPITIPTLKMGWSGSSVHTQYSTDAITSKYIHPPVSIAASQIEVNAIRLEN